MNWNLVFSLVLYSVLVFWSVWNFFGSIKIYKQGYGKFRIRRRVHEVYGASAKRVAVLLAFTCVVVFLFVLNQLFWDWSWNPELLQKLVK